MSEAIKEKILPSDITSYDILKTIAVLLMIVDHIGHYFYPDLLWFRAVGRICVPIWFFLVGYSASQRIPATFTIGGVILVAANLITGMAILPLNVLFSMIAARLLTGPCAEMVLKKGLSIWVLSAILFILMIPTYSLVEYGTQGLMLALSGYMIRHRDEFPDKAMVTQYAIFALILFIAIQQILFGFSQQQFIVMTAGILMAGFWLYSFKPRTFPEATRNLPAFCAAAVRFMGRRTLEIYVAHLVLFKLIALHLGDERFDWFRLTWME
jgi:hypothetical protein